MERPTKLLAIYVCQHTDYVFCRIRPRPFWPPLIRTKPILRREYRFGKHNNYHRKKISVRSDNEHRCYLTNNFKEVLIFKLCKVCKTTNNLNYKINKLF